MYKSAWRIAKQVRALILRDDRSLSGVVETDETYVGGRNKSKGPNFANKEVVFGMVERGSSVEAEHVRSAGACVLFLHIKDTIEPGTVDYSDQAQVHKTLHLIDTITVSSRRFFWC